MDKEKNYHQQSMIWEDEYADKLLQIYGFLIFSLNDIKKLTSDNINSTISSWQIEYSSEIDQLNKYYVDKADSFSNEIISKDKLIKKTKLLNASQLKVQELISSNQKMLNITTEFVRQKFTELSILEEGDNFSPVLANEILEALTSQLEGKIVTYASMSIINDLHDLITYKAQIIGYTEGLWRTQRDNKVRPTHAAMDGKWILLNDPAPMPAGCQPGLDYGCRCYWISFI